MVVWRFTALVRLALYLPAQFDKVYLPSCAGTAGAANQGAVPLLRTEGALLAEPSNIEAMRDIVY